MPSDPPKSSHLVLGLTSKARAAISLGPFSPLAVTLPEGQCSAERARRVRGLGGECGGGHTRSRGRGRPPRVTMGRGGGGGDAVASAAACDMGHRCGHDTEDALSSAVKRAARAAAYGYPRASKVRLRCPHSALAAPAPPQLSSPTVRAGRRRCSQVHRCVVACSARPEWLGLRLLGLYRVTPGRTGKAHTALGNTVLKGDAARLPDVAIIVSIPVDIEVITIWCLACTLWTGVATGRERGVRAFTWQAIKREKTLSLLLSWLNMCT